MESIADFLARTARERQERDVAAAGVVISTTDKNPDQVAGDLSLAQDWAKETGRPVPPMPLVEEYRPVFQQQIEAKRNTTILSSSPKLAEWLRDPQNAALARDDLTGLSYWERVSKSFKMGEATAITQGQEFARDIGTVLERGALGQGMDALGETFDRTLLTNEDGTPNLFGRLANFARSRGMAADGVPRQMVGGSDVTPDQRADAMAGMDFGPIYDGAAALLSEMEKQQFAPMSYKDVDGLGAGLQFISENLSMSLPQMAAAMTSGAFSPFIQVITLGGEANAELKERTDLPEDQRVAIASGAGVVMAGLDYFGISRIFGGIPAGKVVTEAVEGTLVDRLVKNGVSEAVGRTLQAALAEGTTEALQEAIVVGVTAMSGGEYTAEEVIDRLAQGFFAGAGAGGAMRGGVEAVAGGGAASRRMTEGDEKARAAAESQERIAEIAEQSAQSKLRARMPGVFRAWVERATENGPAESLYVPADKFTEYFQSIGLDPYALADEMDGVSRSDLETALATGGDLRIPTATYAARLAGSEADQFFMENMRFDPDEFTSAEARAFEDTKAELMAEALNEAERIFAEQQELRTYEQEIFDTMVERLRIAGRATDVATTEAALYPAFYKVMAERAGIPLGEFIRRYPLPQVRGDIPQGTQAKNVDELTRTLVTARAAREAGVNQPNTPLLEFISNYGGISDRGGELAARDAEVIRRGRGRKNLRLARDPDLFVSSASAEAGRAFGPDDVAMAAIEAGLMADNPVVQEYRAAMMRGDQVPDITLALWEEIDREMRGEASMTDEAMNAGATWDDTISELEQYLAEIGMSLDDDDATIRAAIERDQAERGRMYGQDGRIATDSEAFKAWFGDSKVVGPDGEPLVVYHGTIEDEIEAFSLESVGSGAGSNVAMPRAGFFFTTSKSEADRYGRDGTVIDAYLKIENPIMWDGEAALQSIWEDQDGGEVYPTPADMLENGFGGDYYALLGVDGVSAELADRAVAEGNDGVFLDLSAVSGEKIYIALSPTQIKSVFNRGTFDPNDARILYQGANDQGGDLLTRLLAEAGERIERRNAMADQIAEAGRPVQMANSTGLRALVGPNTIEGEKPFRVTYIGQDGQPNGHVEADTLRDAAIRAMEDGFEPVGGRYNQPAYHGSPHLFERFSLDYMGTGEGAQAFGWGLYFAGRREVAEYYRDTLANRGASDVVVDTAEYSWTGDAAGTIAALERIIASGSLDARQVGYANEAISLVREGWRPGGGRLFEVDIPEDAELLDWDAPLSKQPAGVKELLKPLIEELRTARMNESDRKEILTGKATAEMFYRAYSQHLATVGRTGTVSADRTASEALRAAGIPGHRYLDGGSRADGDGTRNYVVYDDSQVQVRRFEQEQRGSVAFPSAGVGNGDTVISLFRKADLSTFLHESGHYFLTVLQDMASKGEVSAVAEFDTIKGWWRSNAAAVAKDAMRVMPDVKVTEADVIAAMDNGTTGNVLLDAAIDVGMQEQFARSFEQYLMEGKAPSVELRGAFEKFRAWLVSVYRSLRGLNVEIDDNIRAVFDRMLATDQEIAEARAQTGDGGPMFASAEQMGLTDDQYQAFLKLKGQAEDEAAARLLAETMAPIRREAEAAYRTEKDAVRAEVEPQVNARREYRAIEWMGNRRWLGADQPQGLPDMRLDRQTLVDRYGEGVLKTLPRGKFTLYANEGGVDPEIAAGLFGFGSADEMIRALERAPKRTEAITAEVEKVMFERHGDPLRDGTVEAKAIEAVHGDKRAQALALELKALAEIAGSDRGLTQKEAREVARGTLAQMRVRDAMASNRYLTAERKAGQEAQRLAATVTRTQMWMDAARRRVGVTARAAVRDQNPAAVGQVPSQIERANASTARANEAAAALVEAKRRQLLNYMLYTEARKIEAEVEAAEKLAARLQKKSVREKLAGDYLEAIDEILGRYDFRRLSGKAEDRRGALAAYVERMKAEGRENELAIPERVLQDAARTPYKRLTVEHLRGVVDSLKNIEHTARLKQKLIDAQSQRDLDAVVDDILGAFDANVKERAPGRVGTTGERIRAGTRAFLDLVLNAGTLLREIDGFKDLGPAFSNLKAPIDAAMNRLQARREKAAMDLDALYDVYTKDERRKMAVRQFVPEIGASLSKWERIAVALNMGNEGNYQRLTDTKVRGGFAEAQVKAIVADLDERDARFVQSVWDYLESFRGDIEAREKRVTGVAPKWVEPRPVQIAGIDLKGGYYPLKYDQRLSSLARDDAAQDIAKSLQSGRFGKAQTRNGHLKERATSSGRPVELDISVLHRHVQQVVYDLELSEPVANSWRILQDGRIRDAFVNAGKQADFDALEIWLKDVAEGELRAGDVAGQMARRFKSNFTAAKLAFNLSTVAVQITGVAQSMVVVGKADFLKGVQMALRPGIRDEVHAKSQFMRDRSTTFNKDIFDLYNDPRLGPVASRWTEIRNDWIAPAGFYLMTKVQSYLVDVPTWLAGYQKGLRKFGNDEAKAIAYADDVVKRSQASGIFSDRSAVERGSSTMRSRQNEFLRLFTTLGSYMFAKFNVAYERTGRARQVIEREGLSLRSAQEAVSWTIDVAFLFTLEAVLYAAIKGRLPDEEDDEDNDGMADEWAVYLAKETALSFMSTMPFVRDIGSVLTGFGGGGAYGAITEELAKPLIQAGQGEVDAALVKSVISATGLFTGMPSGQINRAVDAGWRQADGEGVSPAEYLLGRMGN